MHDPSPAAAVDAAADPTVPGRSLTFERRWAASSSEQLERTRLIEQARLTDATSQLKRCCPSAARVLERLSWRALTRLAANQPVDPNDPDSWRSPDAHAQIVLRRHGITGLDSTRLTIEAVRALIDGQARADRDAGLDWTRLADPVSHLDASLRHAHARLPIALDDPAIYAYRGDQRRALARRLEVPGEQAGDLSRWLLTRPGAFDPGDSRCWRIASPTWLALAEQQLPPVKEVERPVGLFLFPALRADDGWQLAPVLSLDAIRLVHALGGSVEHDLRAALLPIGAARELVERVNPRTLHAGANEHVDSAGGLAQALARELDAPVSPVVAREKRDRWGRLLVRRRPCTAPGGGGSSELVVRVLTIAGREFPRQRVGAAPRDEHAAQSSAAMELGEAVQTAIERELPLLLSSEAAGQLRDSVRVGRMKGRPGALTITTADGVSASTRRVVAEQALPELRALREPARSAPGRPFRAAARSRTAPAPRPASARS